MIKERIRLTGRIMKKRAAAACMLAGEQDAE